MAVTSTNYFYFYVFYGKSSQYLALEILESWTKSTKSITCSGITLIWVWIYDSSVLNVEGARNCEISKLEGNLGISKFKPNGSLTSCCIC